ncbi:ATP-binding protein [Sulfurimonas paralvinellae]|uniref:ATP-binding protein n=1 Tax=Sulfurimonas paralvinellae TaxID=317658 RepID=A0A7M1B5C9_9BACT|nr:ATP-binding protein [Sulfurimonas paralvinellae]QOP44921.1 ATP-binding protein [Sulfurimonas paralvinellae]
MEILLEEYYKTDLQLEKFHQRKVSIDGGSYQINGITQSGKTKLIKNYLLSLKKGTYLYINCNDIRIDVEAFNRLLPSFCNQNKIDVLALDNYRTEFDFPNVTQLLVASQQHYELPLLKTIQLYPLDYEEFLAYEHKFDSSALNHFVQLGGFPVMHKVSTDERIIFLQNIMRSSLDDVEFDIMTLCAKFTAQKLSAFTLYERLKLTRKISKDKLYRSFEALQEKKYIHLLEKFAHARATKKVYLCDTSLKSALSTEKNFGRLFENMVYLELLKSKTVCYYEDGIDFYLPDNDEIILCKPFADERRLFKKLESLEAFIFSYGITKITVITMNKEGTISHPFAKVAIIPFDIWALGD